MDLNTKEKTKIEGLNYPTYAPYELDWSVEENFFFIKNIVLNNNSRVFKLDLAKMILSPTPYHDLHFSPDGKYYYHMPDEIDYNFRIFNTSTNQELSKKTYGGLGSPMGWVFDSGHLFLFVKKDEEIILEPSNGPIAVIKERKLKSIKYSIFDVHEAAVIKELENVRIGEWISQNPILLFSRDNEVSFIKKPTQN